MDSRIDHSLDIKLVMDSAESFAASCEVGCTVLDNEGRLIYEVKPRGLGNFKCDFCARLNSLAGTNISCTELHSGSGRQAERFGGRYIYFCPAETAYFASAISVGQKLLGTLIGGPVILIGEDDYISEEILQKHGLPLELTNEFHTMLQMIPKVSPARLSHMSNLLFILATHLGGAEQSGMLARAVQNAQQRSIGEHIQELKRANEAAFYPLETEKALMSAIARGDRSASLSRINEILGHIFFKSGNDIPLIRTRISEILALISRAAIDGGAEPELILGLNYHYSNDIRTLGTIEDIAYWLSGVITRFTELVFRMIDVRYTNVIYKATHFINMNYMNKLTLEQTAAYVNMSSSYFGKIFKNATGKTFNNYLNELRVEKSKELLLTSDEPLSEISLTSGFEDQSYFTKIFRKHTGVTPKKYREFRGKYNGYPP